ncbi:hypothetical protein JD844_014914, partial [Phrynosoma platyrhinos]
NEINEVPFFDIQLPYELALKIFQFLGRTELGRCAQVSKAWKVLAEDKVLWFRLCQQEGYLPDSQISDFPCWKGTLRECREKEQVLRTNWKNRIGTVSQLQYELGKVLCDVHSCDGVVIAGLEMCRIDCLWLKAKEVASLFSPTLLTPGFFQLLVEPAWLKHLFCLVRFLPQYTSGDVKLWDTRTWDYTAPVLEPEHGSAEPGPRPHASFVKINSSLAVAAYEGANSLTQHCFFPVQQSSSSDALGNQSLQRSREPPPAPSVAYLAVLTFCQLSKEFGLVVTPPLLTLIPLFAILRLEEVKSLCLVPCVVDHPVVVAIAEEVVYLLKAGEPAKVLHSVYGQPVTCLDVSASEVAFGVKGFGWLINETNKLGDQTVCVTQLGSSLGDFTCVNLRDSPPYMVVAGNKDRRVRVYDVRKSKPACSFYGHQLGVSAVQMDDWKIVSGGEEGLVCVWDQRMGTKLWEMHARHPVRHVWFNAHSLITANIPDEKVPRGACITDDDLTAHRRHRGIIYAYTFSVDQMAAESVLPICRSSYNETTGYNYNIGLAVPYDNI